MLVRDDLMMTYVFIDIKMDKRSIWGCGGIIRRKKGAVGIRINYKGIPMVFISCHLSGIYVHRPSLSIFALVNCHLFGLTITSKKGNELKSIEDLFMIVSEMSKRVFQIW